jgi:erythrocyte band 7 integral membrane protein
LHRSEGELKSAKFLKAAGDEIASGSHAMQLRYLQTLGSIANENNSTIIFPVPIDLFSAYSKAKRVKREEECSDQTK